VKIERHKVLSARDMSAKMAANGIRISYLCPHQPEICLGIDVATIKRKTAFDHLVSHLSSYA